MGRGLWRALFLAVGDLVDGISIDKVESELLDARSRCESSLAEGEIPRLLKRSLSYETHLSAALDSS